MRQSQDIFKNTIWTKNWSGRWGLPLASLYGDIYSTGIQKLVGRGLAHNFIVFESGTTSNYLVQPELKSYCEHLVSLIEGDGAVPGQWADQVITNTDKILAQIADLDQRESFSAEDYYQLQQTRLAITVANFSIKKVIDYLPPTLVEKYLPLFTKVRLHSEPVYSETERLLAKIVFSLTAGRLSAEGISVLLKEEIDTYFSTGQLPSQQELNSRLKGCALLFDEQGRCTLLQGEELQSAMKAIVAGLSGSQIKGMVAFRGLARGRVRIVFDPKTCLDFKEGEILVTGMTRPEYLSIMKKSADKRFSSADSQLTPTGRAG